MKEVQSESSRTYPIQVAAKRSGLSADVIRVWERRYGAVEPFRSETNRRLYSGHDIERLFLLAQVTRAGRRISDVASLSLTELREMTEDDRLAADRVVQPSTGKHQAQTVRQHLDASLQAINSMNSAALDAALSTASVDLSVPVLLEQLLVPLLQQIGDCWKNGTLRIAHEHFATELICLFLSSHRQVGTAPEGAPEIIIATPSGVTHALGAQMVAVLAESDGWKVTHLGVDLSAEEIAAVAKNKGARAVALSIVYPADNPNVRRELRRLGGQLEEGVSLFVGGAAAHAYRDVLDEIDATFTTDFSNLRAELQKLRSEFGSP